MELSEYWIGDWVRIKSRDIRGSFEGIHPSQQAYVKVHDKLLIVPVEDLESTEEPSPDILLTMLEEDIPHQFAPIKQAIVFDHVIDLHYEKLAPERVNNPHTHIIEFQLEKCKEFLEKVIQKKFPFIRIIHGRGQGKLKAAVELLIQDYKEVNLVSSTPDKGALEIWMHN